MDAERVEPAGAWNTFDGKRPPHTRSDQGPTGREVHDRARGDLRFNLDNLHHAQIFVV